MKMPSALKKNGGRLVAVITCVLVAALVAMFVMFSIA